MKITRTVDWVLSVFGIALLVLINGCAVYGPPFPPGVAVVGFVPNYWFWDGYEYVGWYDNDYFYRNSDDAWTPCDPDQLRHVHAWINEHPHWRSDAIHETQNQYPRHARPHRDRDRAHDGDWFWGHNHDHD